MRKRYLSFIFVLSLFIIVSLPVQAQQPVTTSVEDPLLPPISLEVDNSGYPTINLILNSSDEEGRPLTDFSDLIITENGSLIDDFSQSTIPVGVDVAVILDANTSISSFDGTNSSRLTKLQESFNSYTSSYFQDGLDELSILVPASDSGRFLLKDSRDPNKINETIATFEPDPFEASPLTGLLQMGVDHLASKSDNGRLKAIIFYTDGRQSDYSKLDYESIISTANAHNIHIYVVILGARADNDEIGNVRKLFQPTRGFFLHMPAGNRADLLYETLNQHSNPPLFSYESTLEKEGPQTISIETNGFSTSQESTLTIPPAIINLTTAQNQPILRTGSEPDTPLDQLTPTKLPLVAFVEWPAAPRTIETISLLVDGKSIDTITTPETFNDAFVNLEWDITNYESGSYDLQLSMVDSFGIESQTEKTTFSIEEYRPLPPPTPEPVVPAAEPMSPTEYKNFRLSILATTLAVIILGGGLLVHMNRRKQKRERMADEENIVAALAPILAESEAPTTTSSLTDTPSEMDQDRLSRLEDEMERFNMPEIPELTPPPLPEEHTVEDDLESLFFGDDDLDFGDALTDMGQGNNIDSFSDTDDLLDDLDFGDDLAINSEEDWGLSDFDDFVLDDTPNASSDLSSADNDDWAELDFDDFLTEDTPSATAGIAAAGAATIGDDLFADDDLDFSDFLMDDTVESTPTTTADDDLFADDDLDFGDFLMDDTVESTPTTTADDDLFADDDLDFGDFLMDDTVESTPTTTADDDLFADDDLDFGDFLMDDTVESTPTTTADDDLFADDDLDFGNFLMDDTVESTPTSTTVVDEWDDLSSFADLIEDSPMTASDDNDLDDLSSFFNDTDSLVEADPIPESIDVDEVANLFQTDQITNPGEDSLDEFISFLEEDDAEEESTADPMDDFASFLDDSSDTASDSLDDLAGLFAEDDATADPMDDFASFLDDSSDTASDSLDDLAGLFAEDDATADPMDDFASFLDDSSDTTSDSLDDLAGLFAEDDATADPMDDFASFLDDSSDTASDSLDDLAGLFAEDDATADPMDDFASFLDDSSDTASDSLDDLAGLFAEDDTTADPMDDFASFLDDSSDTASDSLDDLAGLFAEDDSSSSLDNYSDLLDDDDGDDDINWDLLQDDDFSSSLSSTEEIEPMSSSSSTNNNAYLEPVQNIPAGVPSKLPIQGEEILLGSDATSVDFILSDPSIAPIHASIFVENNQFFIKDEQSSTGVFVNFKRIGVDPHQLADQDQIHIGRVVFRFHNK